eukprot:918015-Amphidinium_carterae.1
MVSHQQNSHRHTVRYLQTLGNTKNRTLRVDAQLLRIMASEFGGSADVVTSVGSGDSFVMLYSCPSCNTAPLRVRSAKTHYHCPNCAARWTWGTGRQERWVLLYNGDEAEPDYYMCGEEDTLKRSTSFVKTSHPG